MNIGEKISYVRHAHSENEVLVGTGKIKALGLDPDNRVIVLVQDDTATGQDGNPAVFHVHEKCVNPSAEMEENFRELVKAIQKVETEANAEIKSLTDKANLTIDKLKDNLLGEPVEL